MELMEAPVSEGVQAGYKRTEVGVIPADWNATPIGPLIDLLTGFPFPSAGYALGGVRLLRCSNIKRGVTDWSEEITQYWPRSDTKYEEYTMQCGDLVIAMDGSLVGRSFARLSKDDLPALLLQRAARIRSQKLDVGFLTALVGSAWFVNYCDTVKTVTAIPHISPNDIRNFKIPLPPTIDEQRAIATALSDADALITSLEQLIAKKKAIKQGAMQALLTPPGQPGHKRLPGFKGEWVVKRLDQVAAVDPENLSGSTSADYEFRYVALEDVTGGRMHRFSLQRFGSAPSRARRVLRAGDVVVSTVRPNLMSHFLFDKSERDWVCSTGFSIVRCYGHAAHPAYVFTHLFHSTIGRQIEALVTGSNYPAINRKEVAALTLPMPSVKEQTAIATVLTDMDNELVALETKLEKLRKVKQGMMQELLTGKKRLIKHIEQNT